MQAAVSFHNIRHRAEVAEAQINAFLTHLAVNTTMIYTHVLKTIVRKGFSVPLVGNPEASYTINRANPRISCGSV